MNFDEATLSVRQVSHFCGVNRNTVGYWCRSKKIRAHRIGRKYAIPIDDLRVFLKASGRNIPEKLVSQNPQKQVFKTIQPCWQYFQDKSLLNKCKACSVFKNQLPVCFSAKKRTSPGDCNACYTCEYFIETYLPRIGWIHHIGTPAFIYGDLHFWNGNSAGASLCGVQEEDMLGLGVEEIVHADSLEFLISEFRSRALRSKPDSVEATLFFKDGNSGKLKVEVSLHPLDDPRECWLFLATHERKNPKLHPGRNF